MRYLTLIADYTASAIRDDLSGPIEPEDLGLPDELAARLRSWNKRYRAIIPLGDEQRRTSATAATIRQLDVEGLGLADEVSRLVEDVKVRYYSEGLLAYLTSRPDP